MRHKPERDESKKNLKPITMPSTPPSSEKIPDKSRFKPANVSDEEIRQQNIEIKRGENDDEKDPNIEELRQILMDSGKTNR